MKKNLTQKIILFSAIITGILLFWYFDLGRYLTLSYLKSSKEGFDALYTKNAPTVIAVYMAAYILVTSLSLPGAAVMTLAGGALFGLLTGTIVVSFASTIGAVLACFVARFLLRDWIQSRFGDKIANVNAGIEREGTFYLFTLRLIPIFPFWMINLVLGLTKMPLRTFFWVSQVGMLPGTIVFVNAGKELAKIDSLAGILSPGLIFSFVLLGIFPITVKKLMALYNKKRGSREE